MTIKEAEARTGLARANIRYYEDQGFFSPARGENGYRDYSEENIDTLLKIKLLRQLGFSLEEIHQLQNGERALETALAQREAGLERESRELAQAARLCREMRSEGADFYTLDARRYLDRLAREEAVLDQDRDPVRIFPCRRYFARVLDVMLWETVLVVLLQLTVRLNYIRVHDGLGGKLLLSLGGLLLAAAAETLTLHFLGTTPGKALLGLKIVREDGSRLSLGEAAWRTAGVTAFYGAGIFLADLGVLLTALAALAMLIWACWRVDKGELLPWEGRGQLYLEGSTRERRFWENRKNLFRVAGYLAVWALCIGLMVGGHLLAGRPPHRGTELTVEQFVDNYNQYMAFTYGEGNLARRLTVDGTFEEIDRENGSVIIYAFGESPVPQPSFRFTEENGVLTGVTLVQEYESPVPLKESKFYVVYLPYEKCYAAARSLLWSRLGDKELLDFASDLTGAEGNLSREMNGARIDSKMRFSGYRGFGGGSLAAQVGESQSYFVECSITLA